MSRFALALLLIVAGCKEQTRTDAEYRLVGTVAGQRVTLRLVGGSEATATTGVDPAAIQEMVSAAVKGAVPGLDAFEKLADKAAAGAAKPLKLFGMDPETVAAGAASLWGGERVWAARNKRKEREQGNRTHKTEAKA